MKSIVLIAFFISIILPSCKKNNNNTTPTCTLSVAAVAGTYKLTSLKYRPSGGTESEVIGILPACKLDDLTVFNANGTYTYQDAGVVCSPPGNYPGDWTLSGNTITLEGVPGTIETFNCTTLSFYTYNMPNPGDRYTNRYTRQ